MRGIGELSVVVFHFFSNGHALLIFAELLIVIYEFLLPGLHCEVRLPESDNFFARVSVHDNKVAGITRKFYILYFSISDT